MLEFKHVVRDVLHGYVPLEECDRRIIDTPVVQRLRHVRQNDVAFFVYPSLNTTRFEHSLGVLHLAGLLAEFSLRNSDEEHRKRYLAELGEHIPSGVRRTAELSQSFCRAARWYGLLHDIGHLPFSHLMEHCLDGTLEHLYPDAGFDQLHEAAGEFLVKSDPELTSAMEHDPVAAWLVRELLSAKRVSPYLQPLKDIVDADVDADRIDSTARDGFLAGGDYGNYDIARLSRHAVLYETRADGNVPQWRVFFTTRAESAVESLLLERVKTHRWIHYKPKVVAFKNAFRLCARYITDDSRVFHARKYATSRGYLDDAWLWCKMCRVSVARRPSHVKEAHAAVVWRKNTARPLWKRREEFRRLSAEAVKGRDLLLEKFDEKFPALNLLAWLSKRRLAEFEKRLNDGISEPHQFLIYAPKFTPFTPSAGGTDRIGSYQILSHKDGVPLFLTAESRLVQSLRDVVRAEPAFFVTVIVQEREPRGCPAWMLKRFVEVASDMLELIRQDINRATLEGLLQDIARA